MKLRGLLAANLVLLSFAVTVPVAHVFALPQHFALDADLWARAFGHFREAWRAYAGGIAIIALLVSSVLYIWRRKNSPASLLSLNAVFIYAALTGLVFLSGKSTHQHVIGFGLATLGWLVLLSAGFMAMRTHGPRRQD